MSWFRKFEGEVGAVAARVEEDVKTLYDEAAEKVRAFEASLVKGLGAEFAALAAGAKRLEVKIESSGHFFQGEGSATISIVTKVAPVPAEAPALEVAPELPPGGAAMPPSGVGLGPGAA